MTSEDAIPAATLVVWRDSANGPDILVVERSARMAFAAGAIVFPGGRIDEADRALAASYGRPNEAAKVTAIRETVEETGVAPAIPGLAGSPAGLEMQRALHAGADFTQLLSNHGLELDFD
ncbi:MAG TPA: NUDIX domain-containing protein, partial [Sphingomicrobium sp.]|nr:NUDIX domain-containing protein [Sphingomicrobium sp.]